jgi:hypothetical protein
MWRRLAIAALLYGSGHPGFEGMRPSAFDRPLREFHHEVNAAAGEVRHALMVLDDARSML